MAKQDKTAGPTPDADGEDVPETLPPPPPAETRTIEEWRDIRGSEVWAFEACKILRGWAIGQVVAADQYDSAIKAAHTIEVS